MPSTDRSRASSRRLQAAGAIVALALAMTACSSSSKSSGAAATLAAISSAVNASTTSAGAPATNSSTDSSTDSSSGSGSASAPTTAVSTSSAAATTKVSGNSGSSFCQQAKAVQAKLEGDSTAFTTDTPAQLKAFEEEAFKALPQFAANAPAEIRSQVNVLVAADQVIYNKLKSVDFDFSKLSPTDLTSIDTPAFEQAGTAVSDYLSRVCGITE